MTGDPFADVTPLIKRVYAYVAYRVGEGADAEDITSATFERALRYRASFDQRRGDAAAWFVGIARRCIADARMGNDLTAASAPVPEIVAPAEGAHRRLDLGAAISTLDQRDRELVALRYGGDLRTREIADIMGMTPNAVDVALHRALGRLREALADDPRPTGPETAGRRAAVDPSPP